MYHYIILSSSYSGGCRIGLDFPGLDGQDEMRKALKRIRTECWRNVSVSCHSLEASGNAWDDVVKTDPYFEGVKLISSVEEFIRIIKVDRYLSAWDVAGYILSKVKCTNLKLEKLLYFAYADYLCSTNGSRLFQDEIIACTYGPIVPEVYNKCKKYGSGYIGADDLGISFEVLPNRSRILFSEDGIDKCYSIDNTIDKYGKLTASELVNLTHRPSTPWSYTRDTTPILDKDIIAHHVNETI